MRLCTVFPAIAAGVATCDFTADELRGIDRDNALRFLPTQFA